MRTRLVYFFLGLFTLSFGFSSSYGIIIQIPSQQGQTDVAVLGSTSIQENESTLLSVIQLINFYLRSAIGVVCMAVLIWGGVKLITAQGDEKKMAEVNKLLLGALAGIIISLLSYALIKLIVGLF